MRDVQSDRFHDLEQSAARVESEIETHSEEVAARLNDDFAPIFNTWEEGQTKPDFQAHFRALKEKLGDSREKLSLSEERYIDLIRQAVELRGEREELTGGLYDDFSSMRRTIEELYRGRGKGNVNAFVVAGIQGPTAQRPTKLLRQIDLATRHMSQPGLEFPVSRFGGVRLEPADMVEVLAPRAERLGIVQAGLRRVGSELNASRKEKSRAIETHGEIFLWVARSAESLFHLAGEHELAERIRPSEKRLGRRAAEDDDGKDGGSADGSSPAEGSSEAGSGEVAAVAAAPETVLSSSPEDG